MNNSAFARYACTCVFILVCLRTTVGQIEDDGSRDASRLQVQINLLKAQVQQMRTDLNKLQVAGEVGGDVANCNVGRTVEERVSPVSANSVSEESLHDDLALLDQKVNEQEQTKVESSSRYRVRLSGMFQVNFFGNRGVVDNIENPTFPLIPLERESNGSFEGTVRQTQLGLEVVGPQLLGARSSGEVKMDFAGGFEQGPGGSTIGLPRVRTGTLSLDWKNTSLIAGQDALFFSPLSPTSYASLEQPPLAYSGNLWGWVPQIRLEHRFSSVAGSEITIKSGILDATSGEIPVDGNSRDAGVGEASVQPAVAAYVGWSKAALHQPLSFGVGAFRARQYWQTSRNGLDLTSWLVNTDWQIPTTRWTSLSGSFYRGRSVGAFGGGIGQTAVVNEAEGESGGLPVAPYTGLDSMGGWAQFKLQPAPKLEFNTAFGQDNPFTSELRSATTVAYSGTPLLRNRTVFSNVIFRPRSDLLFSLEFRHVHAIQQVDLSSDSANHVNMGIGISF